MAGLDAFAGLGKGGEQIFWGEAEACRDCADFFAEVFEALLFREEDSAVA
jgi:hypothetical protein